MNINANSNNEMDNTFIQNISKIISNDIKLNTNLLNHNTSYNSDEKLKLKLNFNSSKKFDTMKLTRNSSLQNSLRKSFSSFKKNEF